MCCAEPLEELIDLIYSDKEKITPLTALTINY